jgi:uncharacterized membrane protein
MKTLLSASAVLLATSTACAAELYLLGLVPFSYAQDVSADGTVVAGSDPAGCWYWTRDSWVVPIEGSLAIGNGVGGRPGVTDDGNTFMVPTLVGKPQKAEVAFWDRSLSEFDPAVGSLGFNCDISRSSGWSMNSDGSFVGGLVWGDACTASGFVWSRATDTMTLMPSVYFYKPTRVNDVSEDGSFAVGWNDDYTGYRQGCVWRRNADGTYAATLLNTGTATAKLREAMTVSGNGVWAYGQGSAITGGAPYRWSVATGYQPIAPAPGVDGFVLWANFDGSKLLTFFGGAGTFLWFQDRGYVSLRQWAAENGYQLTEEWAFRGFSMTADGLTIVGDALRIADSAPSPFVLDLRKRSGACPADLDLDGIVGATDLASVLGAWGTLGSNADLDGDGLVGATDLAALLGAWGDCP